MSTSLHFSNQHIYHWPQFNWSNTYMSRSNCGCTFLQVCFLYIFLWKFIKKIVITYIYLNDNSPAHVMPLLEIIQTEKTSPQVILDLMTISKIIKKVPVVVSNCTGFAVNRTFFPYKQSAHILLLLGVDLFRIDRLIKNFGLPMGPFQ